MKKVILLSIFVFSFILLSAQNNNLYNGNGAGILFPSTFSPNNDGIDDYFSPEYSGIEAYELTVYNRWGSIIFKTDNIQHSWDGTFDGKECPTGSYFWTAEYSVLDRGKLVKQSLEGNVTLIRE